MKITDLKTYFVPNRFLFLKVETDDGFYGWGEPVVEGRADTVRAAVQELRNVLIGKDPLKQESLWQTMYRGSFYRGGPVLMSAIAGVDQALWDIRGKYYNCSVSQLINGRVRDKIKVYKAVEGNSLDELKDAARQAVKEGYTQLKCAPNVPTHYVDTTKKVDDCIHTIRSIQEAAGDGIDLGVEFHGRIHKPMMIRFAKAVNELGVNFIEEPVLPENCKNLDLLRMYTSTPIALGERLYSRWDFKSYLENNRVDILQPDVSHAGGISECIRIGAMAEAYDCAIAPHCPLSVIAFASCVQLDGALHNAVVQEQGINIHNCSRKNPKMQWLKNPEVFAYDNGYIHIPDEPGLGIEIDEDMVKEANKNSHNWKNPVWQLEDGVVIDW